MRGSIWGSAALSALIVAVATVAIAPSADAATITVATTTDGASGSLRSAIDKANTAATPSTIVLASGATYDLSNCDGAAAEEDTDTGGDLDLTTSQPVTIKGRGATIRQTCDHERVLDLRGTGAVTIDQVTITGGFVGGPLDPIHRPGGGIRSSTGPLTLDRVQLVANSADSGGGMWAEGPVTIRRSVVTDNHATRAFGDVAPSYRASITLRSSTVTANGAPVAANVGLPTLDGLLDPSDAPVVSLQGTVVATPLGGGSNSAVSNLRRRASPVHWSRRRRGTTTTPTGPAAWARLSVT